MEKNKSKKFMVAIVFLSIILVLLTVALAYFIVQNNHNLESLVKANNKISSNAEEYSKKIDEQEKTYESQYESFSSERDSEVESYENAISEKESAFDSEKSSLKDKINELKKQLEIKKKENSTPAVTPLNPPSQSSGQTVYLTFDDGPSEYTTQILDILDSYGVKATFFVIGSSKRSVMKDIVSRGHSIGLHCYTHDYSKVYASDEAYYNDLKSISDVVKEETGIESKIIRFPGGSSNTVSKKYCAGIMTRITKGVTDMGYTYYDWNCDNGDAAGVKTVEGVMKNIKKYPRSASRIIVLMHDTRKVTLEALPHIIEYYQNCGMSFSSITPDVKPVHHGVNN